MRWDRAAGASRSCSTASAGKIAGRDRRGPFERVQSLLVFDNVMRVQDQGSTGAIPDTSCRCCRSTSNRARTAPGDIDDLAGDGAIAVGGRGAGSVLRDVTRPYVAPSGKVPDHELIAQSRSCSA
jgi:hypothetical protein